jgi:hypothetical protein
VPSERDPEHDVVEASELGKIVSEVIKDKFEVLSRARDDRKQIHSVDIRIRY